MCRWVRDIRLVQTEAGYAQNREQQTQDTAKRLDPAAQLHDLGLQNKIAHP